MDRKFRIGAVYDTKLNLWCGFVWDRIKNDCVASGFEMTHEAAMKWAHEALTRTSWHTNDWPLDVFDRDELAIPDGMTKHKQVETA
jgi:hypothetical protein